MYTTFYKLIEWIESHRTIIMTQSTQLNRFMKWSCIRLNITSDVQYFLTSSTSISYSTVKALSFL